MSKEGETRLVPSVRDDARLAFRPDSTEKVDGLMVSIVQADWNDDVTSTDIEILIKVISDVKLLDGNFSTFFHLSLILAILRVFYLVGCSCTTCFELNLHANIPMLIELVVSSKHKTRHGNRVAMGASIALAAAIEAVCTIIFEGSNHLTIASDAETLV